MTVTGKRSTDKPDFVMDIEGILFLAAGYGTRMEPLSLLRPKALLPFGNTTVLGELVRQIYALHPRRVRINASRCPETILNELISAWPIEICSVYFEERPLGVCATLARHADSMMEGTWMIVNTDMIIDGFDAVKMLKIHRETKSSWTVLTGCLPSDGSYSPLLIDENGCFGSGRGEPVHYWGISLVEPEIPLLSRRSQSSGLFSELAPAAYDNGYKLLAWSIDGNWMDMGRIDTVRENILAGGSFIHPAACVSSDVVLEGNWNIGPGCILAGGTVLRNSVMLEGSTLESGSLDEGILPWFCSSRDGNIE